MWFKLIVFLSIPSMAFAQELFIFSEPASTMPKKAVMFRMNSRHYTDPSNSYYYKLNPELGYGLAKNLMGHIEGFYSNWSNRQGSLDALGINAKYRFYSVDGFHKHQRMAVTGKLIYSFNPMAMQWMIEEGHVSLASVGLIYTQLIHKLALSGKINYTKPLQVANGSEYVTGGEFIQWQFSTGLLVLPMEYKNYDQVNLNIYAEYLGQQNLGLRYSTDLPSSHSINHDLGIGMQLIFASKFTTELAYRINLGGNMNRMTNSMLYLNLEYMLFR